MVLSTRPHLHTHDGSAMDQPYRKKSLLHQPFKASLAANMNRRTHFDPTWIPRNRWRPMATYGDQTTNRQIRPRWEPTKLEIDILTTSFCLSSLLPATQPSMWQCLQGTLVIQSTSDYSRVRLAAYSTYPSDWRVFTVYRSEGEHYVTSILSR